LTTTAWAEQHLEGPPQRIASHLRQAVNTSPNLRFCARLAWSPKSGNTGARADDSTPEAGIDSARLVAHCSEREAQWLSSGPRSIRKVKSMAKGQKRSNKEVKKPKQAKPKAPAPAHLLSPVARAATEGKISKK
jgi:hypothetical protein